MGKNLNKQLIFLSILVFISLFLGSTRVPVTTFITRQYSKLNSVAQKTRDLLYSAKTRKEDIIRKARNKCLKQKMNPDENTNPGAPIAFMPSGVDMINEKLTSFEGCKTDLRMYRVLFILSRVQSFEQRSVIRKTYANFTKYSSGSLKGNWTKFFLLGRPQNDDEKGKLMSEISVHKDIVVSNTTDTRKQKGSTIKYLIGLKIASCFCPDADYLIRADDDSYIRLQQTERVLNLVQKEADTLADDQRQKNPSEQQQVKTAGTHARFYTGLGCRSDNPMSRGYWAVTRDEYPEKKYPFNCKGGLNILSMSAVHELAIDCPRHCIGHSYVNRKQFKNKTCLFWIDDVFMGSCVSFTQRDKTKAIALKHKWGVCIQQLNMTQSRNVSNDLVAHGNQYKTPAGMMKVHNYYHDRKLVY